MMVRPQEAPGPLLQAQEGEAQERRPGEVEAFRALLPHPLREALLPPLRRHLPPVLLPPGEADTAVDELDRRVALLPEEHRAQGRMALDHRLPGAAEDAEVEIA